MGLIDNLYLPSRQRTDDLELDAWLNQGQPQPDISMTMTPQGPQPPQNVGPVPGERQPSGSMAQPPTSTEAAKGNVLTETLKAFQVNEPTPEFMQEFTAQWESGPMKGRPMPPPGVLGMIEQTVMMGPHGPIPTGPARAPQVGMESVSNLTLDPSRFQYKVQKDVSGKTGSLAGVKTFDPNLAGVVQVWTDPLDGKTYVVNGHNRVGLAQQTGQEQIAVLHLQAGTAEEARTLGALTNIAEGRGNAIDAAKLFRDTGMNPAIAAERGIPLREKIAADGFALANLHDSLFQEVIQGTLPLERGLVIGSRIADQDQQLKLAQLLRTEQGKGRRTNIEQVRELADFVQSAPQRTDVQETLFGTEESLVSLALDKARIAAAVRDRLSTDKTLFAKVSKERAASRLTETGAAAVNVEESQRLAQESGQLLDLFDRLKHSKGPISDILNDAATKLSQGGKLDDITADAYRQLADALPQALTGDAAADVAAGRGVSSGLTTSTGDTLIAAGERTRGATSEAGIPIRTGQPTETIAPDIFNQPTGTPQAATSAPSQPNLPQQPGALEQAFESPGRFNPRRQASAKLRQLTAEANVFAREIGAMEAQTRGEVSHAETITAANALIRSGKMSVDRILSLEPGSILNAEEGTAARFLRDAVMKQKDLITQRAAMGDEAAKGQLVTSHYLASLVEAATEAASGTEVGRALSARRIASHAKGASMQDMLRLMQEEPLTPQAERMVAQSARNVQRIITEATEQATTPQGKAAMRQLAQNVNLAIEGQPADGQLLAGLWDIMLKGAMQAEGQNIDPDLLSMVLQRTQDAITNAVPPGALVGGLYETILEGVSQAEQRVDPNLLLEFTRQLTTRAEKDAFTKHFAETSRIGRMVDAFLEARTGGLLTHRSITRNLVGSGAATVWSVPERAVTAIMGGPSQGAYTGEAAYMLYGMQQSLSDALSLAGKAFITGESQFLGAHNMAERPYLAAMSSEALGLHGFMGRAVDVYGEIARFMFRGLVAGDDFFKFINYKAEVYAQAYRRYRQMLSSGATEAAASAEYATLVTTPPTWVREAAEQHSLYTTFNDEIINRAARSIMELRDDNGPVGKIARFILPFARSPMNVMGYGAERTPGLNFLSSHFWQEMRTPGVRADAAAARLALGSSIYLVMATLAGNGFITGAGPKDPKLREQYRENGWMPYSFWFPFGVGYVSYLGYEPFSSIIANAANFSELVMQGADFPSLQQMATASVLSSLEFMEDQPMLKSLSQVVDAYRQNDARASEGIMQLIASNFPAPGLQGYARTIIEQVDPYRRETRSPHGDAGPLMKEVQDLYEELAARTPWLSNNVHPERDILGRRMMRNGGWWALFPNAPSAQEPHPVLSEINRQGIVIGAVPKALGPGRQTLTFVGYDPDRMALMLSPSEWDRWQDLAGTMQARGKTLDEALRALIESDRYARMSDGPRGTKAGAIKEIFQDYRQMARDKLISEGPKDAEGKTALQRELQKRERLQDFEQMNKSQQEQKRPELEKSLGRPTNIGRTPEERRGLTIQR